MAFPTEPRGARWIVPTAVADDAPLDENSAATNLAGVIGDCAARKMELRICSPPFRKASSSSTLWRRSCSSNKARNFALKSSCMMTGLNGRWLRFCPLISLCHLTINPLMGDQMKNIDTEKVDHLSPLSTELMPDAWERFERAVDTVSKSGPQHRVTKARADWYTPLWCSVPENVASLRPQTADFADGQDRN